jgi:hypothetical protein
MSQQPAVTSNPLLSHRDYTTPLHVQVLMQGRSVCAILKDKKLYSGREYFVVNVPNFMTTAVPAAHVRRCSDLDGRCTCANEDPTAGQQLGLFN